MLNRTAGKVCWFVFMLGLLGDSAQAREPGMHEAVAEPVEQAVRLTIDPVDVTVDRVHVASTLALGRDPMTARIEPLIQELALCQARWNARHPDVPYVKSLVIAIDGAVPYRVLRKVLFSVGMADYTVRFAANGIALATGRAPSERNAVLGLWIKGDGYVLVASEPSTLSKKAGRYDPLCANVD